MGPLNTYIQCTRNDLVEVVLGVWGSRVHNRIPNLHIAKF